MIGLQGDVFKRRRTPNERTRGKSGPKAAGRFEINRVKCILFTWKRSIGWRESKSTSSEGWNRYHSPKNVSPTMIQSPKSKVDLHTWGRS